MTTTKTFAQLLVLPAMLVSLSATAATEFDQPGDGPFFGETANGQWLIGAKYVEMNNSDDDLESSNNTGVILGYEFNRPVWKGKAAFEFQYLPSTSEGQVNDRFSTTPSAYPNGGEWENPVYSGYVVYRTPGSVLYGKAKVGIVASRFKITTTNTETEENPGAEKIVQENKTQIGYGLGLGVHIGRHFDLELEYEGNQGKSQLYDFGLNAIVKLP